MFTNRTLWWANALCLHILSYMVRWTSIGLPIAIHSICYSAVMMKNIHMQNWLRARHPHPTPPTHPASLPLSHIYIHHHHPPYIWLILSCISADKSILNWRQYTVDLLKHINSVRIMVDMQWGRLYANGICLFRNYKWNCGKGIYHYTHTMYICHQFVEKRARADISSSIWVSKKSCSLRYIFIWQCNPTINM